MMLQVGSAGLRYGAADLAGISASACMMEGSENSNKQSENKRIASRRGKKTVLFFSASNALSH